MVRQWRGSAPCSCNSMKPKDIVLKPIAQRDAERMILENYRSGTFPSGVKLSLGAFVGERCLGCVVFSVGSRFIHTVVEGGRPGDVWELARLWLDDALPKNSESRVLAVAIRIVRRHAPKLKALITYTTKGVGLYKGAAWEQVPGRYGDRYCRIVDGVQFFSSRAVANQYGTINVDALRKLGHEVIVKPGEHRTKWIYWLHDRGRLSLEVEQHGHPLEKAVGKLFRQAPKWLGWPGTETIRHALQEESFAVVEDDDGTLLGCWLLTRLKTKPVFRDVGCVVDRAHRREGLGRRLAEEVKRMCDRENRLLTFDCKEANGAGIAFWRAMGFRATGRRKRGKDAEPYQRFVYLAKRPDAPEA